MKKNVPIVIGATSTAVALIFGLLVWTRRRKAIALTPTTPSITSATTPVQSLVAPSGIAASDYASPENEQRGQWDLNGKWDLNRVIGMLITILKIVSAVITAKEKSA